jgi:uncharacterized RDD family membrane protein YckC
MSAARSESPPLAAPGLWRRLASLLYEGLLLFGIGLISGVIGAALFAVTKQQHFRALLAINFLVYAVYFTWQWSVRGQTLAMTSWSIRVVTSEGDPLSRARALARFGMACLWVAPAWALSMWNGWHGWQALGATAVGICAYAALAAIMPGRQFLHDMACGTRLITWRPQRPGGQAEAPRQNPAP